MGQEEYNSILSDSIKLKLRNILRYDHFCGICTEFDSNMSLVSEVVEILTDCWTETAVLKDVIEEVFNDVENIFLSPRICNTCMEKLIQSYIFICNTRKTAKTLSHFTNELCLKSIDLKEHVSTTCKAESNVVIALNTDYSYSSKKIIHEKKHGNLSMNLAQKKMEKHVVNHVKKTQQYLTAHYKTHLKVKCKICSQIISCQKLNDHLKIHHQKAAHICYKCNSIFYSANDLRTHENCCNIKEEQCVMCFKRFPEDELNSHDCIFNCPECVQMPCIHDKYLLSYREQMLKNTSKVKCLDCDYVCTKKEILLSHVNREHLDHHPYICDKCGQQFYSKYILKSHIYRFHQDFDRCTFCDFEFTNKASWDEHNISECGNLQRQYTCDKCPASFDTTEQHRRHRIRRHTNIFPCPICSKTFLKVFKRKEHLIKVHKGIQIRNRMRIAECHLSEPKSKTKGNNLKKRDLNTVCDLDNSATCETCGRSFQNYGSLKRHQKLHLDTTVNPGSKLRRHWKKNDTILERRYKQRPILTCNSCNHTTRSKILLECHINRNHLKIKPYVCHICSKDFFGKNLIRKHLTTHSNKNVICMVCGKKLANGACLKMHLRLHTGETPYSYDICGDKFRSSSIMNVHKVKKHSDKTSICPLCSTKFHTVAELRRHVIRVHWKHKNKKFNPKELKGLENHYHLFHDGRRVVVNEGDVDYYIPCKVVKS